MFKRIMKNVKPRMAYFPILFSQYSPGELLYIWHWFLIFIQEHTGIRKTDLTIKEYSGFWREYGFGMVALYNSDFKYSGGFDLRLQGMLD